MTAKSKIQWEDINLEKQIPIPPAPARKTAPSVALLERMELNDSFMVPKQHHVNLNTAVARYKKTHKGRQFIIRTVDGGDTVRCWRVK
jgi:hypothetical protein